MKNLSLHRNLSLPSSKRDEVQAANKQRLVSTAGAQLPADASRSSGNGISDKSSDTRFSEKEIKDTQWDVDYYKEKLLNATTSSDKVLYYKLLQEKEAKLDSLKAQKYTYDHGSTAGSSSHASNAKAIKDAEWEVNYYKDKLLYAAEDDQVFYYDLLKEKEAKLDALKAPVYSSAHSQSFSPSTNYSAASSSKSSTGAIHTSAPALTIAEDKVSQNDIDKAKDDIAYYTKKVNETKVSQTDINKVKDDINHYAMKSSQTKVSAKELGEAQDDVAYYEKKCKETKVSAVDIEKAEDDVDFYAKKCNDNKVSEKEIGDAEDDVNYYKNKCYRYPQHSPEYAATYKKYISANADLDRLKHLKSFYASYYGHYADSKKHLANLKSDMASHNTFANKLTNSEKLLANLKEKQANHSHFSSKLADSKQKLADLETKQESHQEFSNKLSKSKQLLADLETKKASAAKNHSYTASSTVATTGSSNPSAPAENKLNFQMEKVISDMEFYKNNYIASAKGSSDEKYYLEKYVESSGKLDELKKKDDNDFYASLNITGKVSQADIDNVQKDYDYFNKKFQGAKKGSKEYDFYLDQSTKAQLTLKALKDHKANPAHGSTYINPKPTYVSSKPTTSVASSTFTTPPVSTSSSSKPVASQSNIDAAKADMDYWYKKWTADTDSDTLWNMYWSSKKKLEKLENPAQIISALTVNASTPSYQAPVPKSKPEKSAQEQIQALEKHAKTHGLATPNDHHVYTVKMDAFEDQQKYEDKLAKMEADTGDNTPASGHNYLKADYVISSHGSYKAADGWVDLPPGIFIRTNAKHGSPINNGLGWALEEDRASNYRFSELWTNKIRNYTITKEPDFENNLKAQIIQVPIPQKEQHILDIVGPYAPTHFDPKKDKPLIFDAAFCLADSTSDNYDYTFGPDGPYKK